jgi:hypothetical protein
MMGVEIWISNFRFLYFPVISGSCYLRTRYDTRIFERYEGPSCCPEEVSLTSIPDAIRSITINNSPYLPVFGMIMPVQLAF